MNRAALFALALAACAAPPDGLRKTPNGSGPLVLIDWDARPLPELPLPNDLATRPDPTSPTGLRVNIAIQPGSTQLEREVRTKIDTLTGWGLYSPITVRFDAPLDLDEIAARHPNDGDFSDDAFFVIDVTPGSPTYLQPVDLDVGHGHFPGDVADPGAYFPNDALYDTPSVLFDTHDEDRNGNGELDWGEDVDGDGWLDVPNVYPEGGDPRDDLLTWYERVTNTLILRPVLPLREETTYAVVLTERILGEDGQPVRSPWEYVNHSRQTEALRPLFDGLPELGVPMGDVAFAWTFTTARVTGDLVDLRRSLDGEGPFAWLPDEYPPGVHTADVMHENDSLDDQMRLPVSVLTGLMSAVGFVGADELDILVDGYASAESVVGGRFTTPNLLSDKDDGGDGDTVEEYWVLDPHTGEVVAEPQDVAFTCVLPKATPDNPPPFDVQIYGHGYGSSRFETFAFAWAWVRLGVAVCFMDFPGHGVDLGSDRDQVAGVLEPAGLTPFLEHLEFARATDTNNDGSVDSGSHQWSADSFHTRDQVRQATLDWMWLLASLRQCGTGTMDADGDERVSCDWDGDGTPDIGGPDAKYMVAGGSLGGIVNGVAAAVLPEVEAHVPIVPGAGLLDVSTRAPTGGAVEAMHGRLQSPYVLGRPQADGSLAITQMVDQFMDMDEFVIGSVPSTAAVAGGRVVVENLANGEVREVWIPDGTWLEGSDWSGPAPGAFRVSIPADALDYYEKRVATGMPEGGPGEGETYGVPGNDGLGDPLVVTVYDPAGAKVAVIDTFSTEVVFEGVTYEAGSPLVALASGYGRVRAAPETRRLMSIVAMVVEPGDPVAYASHYVTEPFEALGGEPTNVLIVPTPGDMVVAINAGIAHARVAGFIERRVPDERYGTSIDQWLIDRRVVHGLEEFGPYKDVDGRPCLFDADDLDNGTDEWKAPSDAPLRVRVETEAGVSGLRLPYVAPRGIHGIRMPDNEIPFDMSTFVLNQAARYLTSGGTILTDDPCMEDSSCDWIPATVEAQ